MVSRRQSAAASGEHQQAEVIVRTVVHRPRSEGDITRTRSVGTSDWEALGGRLCLRAHTPWLAVIRSYMRGLRLVGEVRRVS